MESDLKPQDQKDLDKFIKFFALKTVQVIVQARLGEKICTRSSSSPTGSDWFNLAIKDIPEVTHEAKKALAGQLPGIGRSMCVEISLKTSEGDSMELETWCLEMNEKCDKEIKVSYAVYNRLSVLLKSLLAITRVTPAYKLSRKQGHDYVILYRIYFGEVQLSGLGEGFQTVRVGVVGTPIGTITLSCAYRTNLAFMSNRQFERSAPIMGIIVDHFVDPPCSSQRPANMGHPCNYRAPDEEDGGQFTGVQDSQEVCATSFSTSPPSQCVCTLSPSPSKLPKPLPLDSLQLPLAPGLVTHTLYASRLSYQPTALAGAAEFCHPASNPNQVLHAGKEGGALLMPPHGADVHLTVEHAPNTPSSSGDDDGLSQSGERRKEEGRRSVSPSDPVESLNAFTRKVGAFVNKPSTQITAASLDLPFAAFAPRGLDSEENDPMVHPPDSPPCPSPLQGSLHSQGSEGSGQQDDFVMVDFRPAFSKDDLLPMDLGTFYREFQNPPQLASLSLHISSQSMADDLDSLPEKLRVYEKNIDEFDAFVDMLQ
ncbi:autophagy-related protein 13 isoform X1 [Pundamilia nyererei]|uniref:Autophagy-related protein 13 n=2 Tax=Haplochromini TaxID=319058 RepID=A0A3B4FB91_9CICH|nr:PREDICTED: autophagy-related protein 13 isoform X1 [Pundamilia nyererei]XP_005750565.1 PREDICTED: autophagy-related protein 13 isoform X1 [Pundamilia nyererei]XP_005948779.1 autophagy-related protein 13 isoform X1 [Haplochromis burtoni]